MGRMTRVKALKKLQECVKDDPEAAHSQADEILCLFIENLGYTDVVDAWRAIKPKWYA